MNTQKKRLYIMFSTIAVMIGLGIFIYSQLYSQHQTNMQVIDNCFEQANERSTISIKKDGLFNPVICE